MEDKEIKQQCMELLKQTDALYLSTIDGDGFPQTRVLMNLKSPAQCPKQAEVLGELGDDFSAYMTTSTSSPKLEHIKQNPKSSVYFCDLKGFKGVLIMGELEILADTELKRKLWQDEWKMYYKAGVDDPEYNIIVLKPQKVKCWFAPMPEPAEFTV